MGAARCFALVVAAATTHFTEGRQYAPPRGRALIPLHGFTASGRYGHQAHFSNSWLDQEDAIDAFLYDAGKIFTHVNNTLTTPCHLIYSDSSYTRSWTNTDWERHCQRSVRRYARHFFNWHKSNTAHAVLPFVIFVSIWSAAVCLFTEHFPIVNSFIKKASLKSSLLASFASPIALLLTLKTNRALDRVLDTRKAWGMMTRVTRALAGMACAYVAPTNGPLALLLCRYLVIFPWCLKGRLRGEDDEEVIRCVLPPEEAEWLLQQEAERPIAILSRIRCLLHLAQTGNEVSLPLPMSTHLHMGNRLHDLETVVGTCNRILGSPIPPTFTRMTSRLICLYLLALPFALLGLSSNVSPVAVVLTSTLTAYVLCGIDEIGVELEHPFPIMPMQHMSTFAQKGVMAQIQMMRTMPKV
jgi:putative membrane protein